MHYSPRVTRKTWTNHIVASHCLTWAIISPLHGSNMCRLRRCCHSRGRMVRTPDTVCHGNVTVNVKDSAFSARGCTKRVLLLLATRDDQGLKMATILPDAKSSLMRSRPSTLVDSASTVLPILTDESSEASEMEKHTAHLRLETESNNRGQRTYSYSVRCPR